MLLALRLLLPPLMAARILASLLLILQRWRGRGARESSRVSRVPERVRVPGRVRSRGLAHIDFLDHS